MHHTRSGNLAGKGIDAVEAPQAKTQDRRSQANLAGKSLTLKNAHFSGLQSRGRGSWPDSPARSCSDIAHSKLSETDKEYIADLFERFAQDDKDGVSTLTDDWVSNLDAIVSHKVTDRKRQNRPCSTTVQIAHQHSEDDVLPPSAMPATLSRHERVCHQKSRLHELPAINIGNPKEVEAFGRPGAKKRTDILTHICTKVLCMSTLQKTY